MEMLVDRIEKVLNDEPIDIYVNPTFLPDCIAAEYDALWTPERMDRVIRRRRRERRGHRDQRPLPNSERGVHQAGESGRREIHLRHEQYRPGVGAAGILPRRDPRVRPDGRRHVHAEPDPGVGHATCDQGEVAHPLVHPARRGPGDRQPERLVRYAAGHPAGRVHLQWQGRSRHGRHLRDDAQQRLGPLPFQDHQDRAGRRAHAGVETPQRREPAGTPFRRPGEAGGREHAALQRHASRDFAGPQELRRRYGFPRRTAHVPAGPHGIRREVPRAGRPFDALRAALAAYHGHLLSEAARRQAVAGDSLHPRRRLGGWTRATPPATRPAGTGSALPWSRSTTVSSPTPANTRP